MISQNSKSCSFCGFKYETYFLELLKKFFDRIELPDLIGCKDIIFIFNAKKIEYENQTPIEKFFDTYYNIAIIVNDKNLL